MSEMVYISNKIPKELKKQIKLICIAKEITISEFITEALKCHAEEMESITDLGSSEHVKSDEIDSINDELNE